MTAIIWDGKTLAADRKLTREGCVSGYEKKISKWSKGYVASAGRYDDFIMFKQWVEDRDIKWKPHGNFQGLFIEGKQVFEVIKTLIPMPVIAPFGIGSGGVFCELLVRECYTAKEAIQAVSRFMISVGGKVDVVTVG